MTHQWTPEQVVEPDLALSLIQEQFPELVAEKISLLGIGWDNTAYLINDQWVFRFPRRTIAVPLVEVEWNFLPKIAPKLPIPVPYPKWAGRPSSSYPWPFLGYSFLTGKTACSVDFSDQERIKLAKPLAEFLQIIHATSLDEARSCGLEGDTIGRLDVARMTKEIQKNLTELSMLGLIEPTALVIRVEDYKIPEESTVVHGDFYARHFLVSEQKELVGVIDWGDLHIGDPAIDFEVAFTFLPEKGKEVFRRHYGEIDEKTWELAALRSLHAALALMVYAHHHADQHLFRELKRAFERERRNWV